MEYQENINEILELPTRLSNSILLGESHFREFKSAFDGNPGNKRPRRIASVCRDISEALVAFTNADGGELLIGVEDNGEVTGVPYSPLQISEVLRIYKTGIMREQPLPLIHETTVIIDSKNIIFICVSKSDGTIYQLSDGRCVRRQDKSTIPISFAEINFAHSEQLSREYDRAFVDDANTSDLDMALVRDVANHIIPGMSAEAYLQQISLAEYAYRGLRLRRAALLLFSNNIAKWFPRCQIRILRVAGTEVLPGEKYNVTSDESVTDNIFRLLGRAWDMLRPYLSESVEFGADARFRQNYVYPESACREALINAIAHRDYNIQNPILILIYNDRIAFESPGELLSTVDIQQLRQGKGVHESRNLYIARTLRENEYMRELGEGIRRIIELMSYQELAAPQINSENGKFTITLHHKSVYNEKEQMWLSNFEYWALDASQKRIVIAGMAGKELSPRMIYAALRSNDRNLYDQTVTTLRVSGILIEIRTNVEASGIARRSKILKQDVPRFAVTIPITDDESPDSLTLNRVFVYGLPKDCSEADVKNAATIFGKVVSVELPRDSVNAGIPKGFAYITFDDALSATKALAIRNIKISNTMATIIPYRKYWRKRIKQRI